MENSARDEKSELFSDDAKYNRSDSYPAERQLFLRSKRDWSKMADDVCRLIVGKLWFSTHQCRFAAACRNWYRVAREAPCPFEQNSPFVLIPHNDEIETGNCSLFHVADSKTFLFNVPELRGKHVHGSCNGWLVAADDDYELSLVNILTRTQIALPEPSYALDVLEERYPAADDMLIPALRDCWMKKFVVSDSPTSTASSSAPEGSGCLVAAIMSLPREMFFCCLGDESWTHIWLTNGVATYFPMDDLIFFRGRLYAASDVYVIVVDFDGPQYTKAVSMRGPTTIKHTNGLHTLRVYLVECSDSLLYVDKFGKITNTDDGAHHTTYGFEVYKLEKDAQTWSRIHELWGHSLFLGLNQSVAISAEEVPWCRPNSIYYVDDVCDGPGFHGDNGVFTLEDGRIELFDDSYSAACRGSLSLWFQQKIR